MQQDRDKPQKRTRKRLRVSCVECTRRRQKCDRTQPCGLCKKRGVEHLCRWELEPFARPAPSRPHASRKAENKLSPNARTHAQSSQMSKQEQEVIRGSILRETLEDEVKEAAIALAQLSAGRHGEHSGRNSIVCALDKLNDSSEMKIPINKSSRLSFSRSQYTSAISNTFLITLQNLVSDLPNQPQCDALITSFFKNDSWRFGLPEELIISIYHSMWDTIVSDERAFERLNFNWVAFLFAMLALSSGCLSEQESRKYFLGALTAKRLAEDIQFASFFTPRDLGTFSQGAAYGCIATALMAEYMCDRGQLTEAWKLIGSAVRSAQNTGLHLYPSQCKRKDMTKDEQTLRKLAWHLCAAKDRFLSFAFGRPSMVHSCEYHVPITETSPLPPASDGTSDITWSYQAFRIRLIEIVAEEKNKHLRVIPDPSVNGEDFEFKMSSWEASLPSYFALRDPDTSFDPSYPKLRVQRCLLACYYHFSHMHFYRSLPCLKRLDDTEDTPPRYKYQWDFDRVASFAIDLLHSEKSLSAILTAHRQASFTETYFIFEAAVTLSIAICRDGDNARVEEWREERDIAIDVLQSLLSMGNSELTQQAIAVLRILQDKRLHTIDSQKLEEAEETSLSMPLSWTSIDSLSTMFSTMFSAEALQSQGSPEIEQSYDDSGSAFGFSGFDFLFNLQ